MLDHLCINAPFESSFYSVNEAGQYFFIDVDLHSIEIPLASRSVHKNDDGTISAAALFHPFESVPTHYTGMAMKVFFDSAYEPYVQIKASPAKLLQGHNVFGGDDIEQGAMEMIGFLHEAYPLLARMLDWERAWVSHIDVTYSARLKDQRTAHKVLDYLGNVSNGQTRISKKAYDTSRYWGGATSRLVQHKCYLKHEEFLAQFSELQERAKRNDKSAMRVVEVMSDQRLVDWTIGLLRFESRLKKRWLERNRVPTNLFELIRFQKQNPELLQTLWTKATHRIFEALRGQTMKLTDDKSVLEAIERSEVVMTKSGKASPTKVRNLFAMYCLIREKGIDELKTTYSKTSFHRLVADLCLCGFSKAYLHNLHNEKANNIIPFVKLVEIDFNQQLPEWYQEPNSQFNYKIA
ncbi:phage/plasmid replication protein, II/X family [Acinetobacter junii]|uniref:phage/plasmid replication protein, II/X family n=1 Tax=Acinetobacter junii TaxID=40215 RepID=UPI0022EA15E1|nr:phage/plasmid replication protein, II/X family [Acinetobacter junii]MDA3508470.1 phage/plasmid replication protein, II/X family [Acinetobacter junii]MDA3534048.1 phage/plasmid replication protein, II/X family [Acinetobacter junii]